MGFAIIGDTHTHTLACQHAYSTIAENAAYAKKIGLRFLALTDHCRDMAGSAQYGYFENLDRIPRELDGVVILRGCEANIHEDGTLDLRYDTLATLDWVIASMHRGIMPLELTERNYTEAWLKIAANPYVDCIGHLGNPSFPCDYETVIKAFAKGSKAVEINNSSPASRPGSEDNCREILRLCKKYGVKLVVASDAHFFTEIGCVDWASEIVTESGYCEEDILNLDWNRMRRWLQNKKGLVLPE